ncbi:hypothetical protein VNO78_12291 [Psophocarpus tetragonolobus]|uniref:Molybdopterin synthase catalytic subunit n=1 Tax=Psophocarpus tetragonolobus TaxID=3891 RepID=A0AAN9SPL7_PSOTE
MVCKGECEGATYCDFLMRHSDSSNHCGVNYSATTTVFTTICVPFVVGRHNAIHSHYYRASLSHNQVSSVNIISALLNAAFNSVMDLPLCGFVYKMAAEEDKNLVEILESQNPIDVAKYMNFVSAPQAGAIATFSGTTRDTFEGKAVMELRYEAYVPMAMRCIKTLCSSARASWSLHSIAVAHRLGTVAVGETSVFVAVSSVHRADALEACRFLIDEIKAQVPIWKKEVYANGEVWKENSEFLERRSEIGNNDTGSCGKKAEMKEQNKKCGCGTKVRVDNEAI